MLSREAEDELSDFLMMCFRDDQALGIDARWKRSILDECRKMLGGDPYCCGLHGEKILRTLTEPYRDYPDFRQEWLL